MEHLPQILNKTCFGDKVTRRDFAKKATLFISGLGVSFAAPLCAEEDLDFKIGQMIMTHFPGLTVGENIKRLIEDEYLGGVLLFENNFSSATSPQTSLTILVESLQNISDTPLLIAMDQEGGVVNRLKEKYGFPLSYSAQYLGERNDPTFTKSTAATIAAAFASIGINHNFAPVVDLKVNPLNQVVGTNGRCFSANPDIVTEHAAAFIQAHREKNIITTLKHFPGHGSSTHDSHLGLADVTHTWHESELIPYKNLIVAGLVDSVMTAHIFNSNLDNVYPASLSHKTVTRLLRQNLGFDGVVISDDLLMKAIKNQYTLEESIYHAINAGNDILLFTTIADNLIPRVKNIIKQHVKSGKISPAQINHSFYRISKLKQKLS